MNTESTSSFCRKFTVCAEHPIFDVHFPGRPMLPGAMLCALIEKHCPIEAYISKVRFNAVVLPGSEVSTCYTSGAGNAWRFKAVVNGEEVASGQLRID